MEILLSYHSKQWGGKWRQYWKIYCLNVSMGFLQVTVLTSSNFINSIGLDLVGHKKQGELFFQTPIPNKQKVEFTFTVQETAPSHKAFHHLNVLQEY